MNYYFPVLLMLTLFVTFCQRKEFPSSFTPNGRYQSSISIVMSWVRIFLTLLSPSFTSSNGKLISNFSVTGLCGGKPDSRIIPLFSYGPLPILSPRPSCCGTGMYILDFLKISFPSGVFAVTSRTSLFGVGQPSGIVWPVLFVISTLTNACGTIFAPSLQ